MAIQKIVASDKSAPKFETYRVLKKAAMQSVYIALALSLLTLFFSKGLGSAIIVFLISLFVILMVRLFILQFMMTLTKGKKEYNRVHDYYKNIALKNNMNISYEAPGIIIDNESKKIAFTINPNREKQLTICDFSDVRQWYSHESVVTNDRYTVHSSGRVDVGRTEHNFTGVRVEINDPDTPVYFFWTANQGDSDLWIARISSLING